MTFAQLAKDFAVVVKNNGKEVMFFWDKKDAGAWICHVYGSPAHKLKNITIESIKNRGPRPGDVVHYDGSGHYKCGNGEGVLEYSGGGLLVLFNASAFRQHESVSCSGGPGTWLEENELQFKGLELRNFWRWHDGFAGASQGGSYQMMVPVWTWNGGVAEAA